MPEYFSDAIDDPLVFDSCPSFSGGQVSFTRANLLKPEEAALLVNCDVSRNGEISTRRGSVRLGSGTAGTGTYIQGLSSFETPTYNYPVAANGGKLYSYDGAAWNLFANSWSASDSSGRVLFAQGIDKLYFTDRVGHLWSWDGTTEVDEGATDTNTDPPRAPQWITWFASRLCVVGGPSKPDTIYFSQFLDATAGQWDRIKWSLRVGGGEGDPITGLWGWLDFNLIVFKRHSVWVVNIDPQLQTVSHDDDVTGFNIKPIHRKTGCIAPATAAQVGSDVFFLARDGVRSIKRTLAAETQSEASDPISLPIQDLIDRINWNAAATFCGNFWNNRYFLSVALDGASAPNYVIIYNALLQTWSGYWTGWTPTVFAGRSVNTNVGRMLFGQANGNVHEWLDYVQVASEVDATFQDNGVDIPVTIKTRALTFDEPICSKTGLHVEFEFNGSTAELDAQVVLDDGSAQMFHHILTVYGSGPVLPITLPFTLGRGGIVRKSYDLQSLLEWRELQFLLTTTSKKLVLRSITASGMVNTLQLQT